MRGRVAEAQRVQPVGHRHRLVEGTVGDGGVAVGNAIAVGVVKNRLSPSSRQLRSRRGAWGRHR